MHYIRFLKAPSLIRPKDGHGVQVTARITITTDLGEAFLASDLELSVVLMQQPGGNSYASTSHWKAGSRQLDISIKVNVKSSNTPYVLSLIPRDPTYLVEGLMDLLDDSSSQAEPVGRVLGAMSEPILSERSSKISRKVKRLLKLSDRRQICIWEETGESIARHIWDAGLVLSAYLDGYGADAEKAPASTLNSLEKVLLKQPLQVLELGAGCGIVGITIATRFPSVKVLLTDLPEAEEIATYNISATTADSNGNPPNLKYQNLDWAQPLPENLQDGTLDLVLVADCTYNSDVVPDLVKTLADIVRYNKDVFILLAMKVRHDSEMIFFDLMKEKQIHVVEKIILPLPLLGQEAEEIEVYIFAAK